MATSAKPRKRTLDFTDVKDRSEWNPRLVEEGDYEGKILGVVEQKSKIKEDGSGGEDMWVFAFGINDMPSARYPYYCVLNADNLWKIRNIASACGKSVGGRKLAVDPSVFVGKGVALSMVTEAGTGNYKDKSVVDNIFKLSDLLGESDDDTSQSDDDDDDADDEPEPPKRRAAARRKPAAVEPDDDDEEDDEPEPPKRTTRRRKPAPEPVEDDDDEDEDDEPEPPKRTTRSRRKPAAPVVEDDDDEEEEPPVRRRRAPAKSAAPAARRRKPAPVDDDDDDDMEIEEL